MSDTGRLLEKAAAGERLSLDEGVEIISGADLIAMGKAADLARQRLHPDNYATFVIDRNINYTNVCSNRCSFCAFYREAGDKDAYVLGRDELFAKVEETVRFGGTELLIQGGLHPDLGLDYYLEMLMSIKERFKIHIHSFSPPEIMHMVQSSGLGLREVIARLKKAGLDSIPGGGAEILEDSVRKAVSPRKIGWRQWMEVMLEAHRQGMRTTATMMYGHAENLRDRVLHMVRVRDAQDVTGGFTAFIPWSFQPGHTRLGGKQSTGVDYLRTLATARLMLDNINNIQASWVTQGSRMAQVALSFGANDFGSTMLEENVVKAAGVCHRVSREEILRLIRDAGRIPAQRDTLYGITRVFNSFQERRDPL